MIAELIGNTLDLYLDAAPWLLLGLLAAGLIKAWVPEHTLSRRLGGGGSRPVVYAALIGAPLPLCSCGVLPAALGLHRGGASRPATVSFLIATPETGVDSIAVSYALLGPVMAVVRPLAAILSAIFTGLLSAIAPASAASTIAASDGCSGAGCCAASSVDSCATPPPAKTGGFDRTIQGVRYAATDILDDIALWLVIGILLAGAVATFIPPQTLAEWGSGLPAMLLMLLVGVPMYICATASTPMAAALLLAGISPGTVLVFLLAGPATNIATLAVVRRELGGGVLLSYLAGIAVSSISLGLLLDWALQQTGIDVVAQMGAAGELAPTWLAAACGAVMALLVIRPVRRQLLGN